MADKARQDFADEAVRVLLDQPVDDCHPSRQHGKKEGILEAAMLIAVKMEATPKTFDRLVGACDIQRHWISLGHIHIAVRAASHASQWAREKLLKVLIDDGSLYWVIAHMLPVLGRKLTRDEILRLAGKATQKKAGYAMSGEDSDLGHIKWLAKLLPREDGDRIIAEMESAIKTLRESNV